VRPKQPQRRRRGEGRGEDDFDGEEELHTDNGEACTELDKEACWQRRIGEVTRVVLARGWGVSAR
jgi:hypothetical protein